MVQSARRDGADLVVLPEFFNTEYFAQYRDLSYLDYGEALDGPSLTEVAKVARSENVWVVATILERQRAGYFYDTAVLIDRLGVRRGVYRKTHPAATDSLEKIYFRFGTRFPVFAVEGWRVGVLICYDLYFPEVARCLTLRGAELLLAPFATLEEPAWKELNVTRAFENGCYVASCNKVGVEGDWNFPGRSMISGPDGSIVAHADQDQEQVVTGQVDFSLVELWRRKNPVHRDRRPDLYSAIVAPTDELVAEALMPESSGRDV